MSTSSSGFYSAAGLRWPPQVPEYDSSTSIFQRPNTIQGQTASFNASSQVPMFQHLQRREGLIPPTSPEKDHWNPEMKTQVMVKRNRPAGPMFGAITSFGEVMASARRTPASTSPPSATSTTSTS